MEHQFVVARREIRADSTGHGPVAIRAELIPIILSIASEILPSAENLQLSVVIHRIDLAHRAEDA